MTDVNLNVCREKNRFETTTTTVVPLRSFRREKDGEIRLLSTNVWPIPIRWLVGCFVTTTMGETSCLVYRNY